MLFEIQAYLEDYLSKRNLADSDGYAVHLANLYFHQRPQSDLDSFLRRVRRIRTVMFANNQIRDRSGFERSLVSRLDRNFKKKLSSHNLPFSLGTGQDGVRLQRLPRRTISGLLTEFKYAVEARAVDCFWESRVKGKQNQLLGHLGSPTGYYCGYRADEVDEPCYGWRPSIHMPRWASRILLEITNVRVERVQDITSQDIDAEGLSTSWFLEYDQEGYKDINDEEQRDAFRELWDGINAKRGYGWDVNPWVFVITFKRIEL